MESRLIVMPTLYDDKIPVSYLPFKQQSHPKTILLKDLCIKFLSLCIAWTENVIGPKSKYHQSQSH